MKEFIPGFKQTEGTNQNGVRCERKMISEGGDGIQRKAEGLEA